MLHMQLGPGRTAIVVSQPAGLARYGVHSAALTTSPQAVMPAYLLSSAGNSQARVSGLATLDTPKGLDYTFI